MADLASNDKGASKEYDSSGIILWNFVKDSITEKSNYSPSIEVGGIPWSLCVKRKRKDEDDVTYLGVYLHSMDGDYFVQGVEVEYEIKLINHDNEEETLNDMDTQSFEKEDNWGFDLIKWDDVIDVKKGYLKDNKLTIQVRFCLLNIIGLRLKSRDDLFGSIRWEVDENSITEKNNFSPLMEVGGIPWSLCVKRKRKDEDDVAYLGVYLHSMDGDYFVQSVEVEYEIKLINHDNEEETLNDMETCSFEKKDYWGSDLIKWDDGINEEKGYIKDNKFTLQVRLWLVNIIGLRLKSKDDLFGLIRWEVNKDSITEKNNLSPLMEVGGIPWSLRVNRELEDVDQLAIYLHSMDGDYFVQSVEVEFETKLINHDNEEETITNKDTKSFKKDDYWFSDLIEWDDVIDEEKGFMKDNKLTLQVLFCLSNITGLRLKSKDDLFGLIRWEVNKDSITEKNNFSPLMEVGGIPWSLSVNREVEEDVDNLAIYLHSMDGDYFVQSVEVEFEIKLINHDNEEETITNKDTQSFEKEDNCGSELIEWDDVIDEEKGYMKDNKLTLQVRFCVSNIIGFRTMARIMVTSSVNDASKEDDLFGMIRWEIDKDSIAKESSFSPSIEVGGIPWSLCVQKEDDHLAVFLYSMDGDYIVQSVEVVLEFKLINHKDDAETIIEKFTDLFKNVANGYSQFIKWDEATNAEKGYIVDNKLTVQVRFLLMNIIGLRHLYLSTNGESNIVDGAAETVIGNCMVREFHKDFISNVFILSTPITVGGMQWRTRLNTTDNDEYLSIYLAQFDEIYEMQSVDVTNEYKLINYADDYKSISKKSTMANYTKDSSVWGHSEFVKWNDVLDEKKGFLKNGRIRVQMKFSLSNFKASRKLRRIDFSDSLYPSHNVALVINGDKQDTAIGEEKVYANKEFLSIHSPVFHRMFFGEFVVKNQKEFELKDINRKEFLEFLNMIYSPSNNITDDNVAFLLKLAVRFHIDWIVYQCEDHLFTSEYRFSSTHGVILWEIDKESITEEDCFSPSTEVGGMPWSLRVKRRDDHLSVFLHSMDGDYTLQNVEVLCEIKLINHKDFTDTVTQKYADSIKKNNSLGFFEFIKWDEATDKEKGYINDNKLTFQVRFLLSNIVGHRIGRDSSNDQSSDIDATTDESSFLDIMQKEFHKDFISSVFCNSTPIRVGGIQWKIKLKTSNDEYLSIYLCPFDEIYKMESVHVTAEFKLINHNDDTKTIMKSGIFEFGEEHSHGYSDFAKWNDVVDEIKGFIKNDRIKVQIKFYLSNFVGFRQLRRLDFTNPNVSNHDVALIIEGKKIYTNKQFLSIHSPIFHRMFYGESAVKNQKEFELKNISRIEERISISEFLEFLNIIYPPFKKITDDNVDFILKLAVCFHIDWIVSQCEQHLFTSTELPMASKLLLNGQFRHFELQEENEKLISELAILRNFAQNQMKEKEESKSNSVGQSVAKARQESTIVTGDATSSTIPQAPPLLPFLISSVSITTTTIHQPYTSDEGDDLPPPPPPMMESEMKRPEEFKKLGDELKYSLPLPPPPPPPKVVLKGIDMNVTAISTTTSSSSLIDELRGNIALRKTRSEKSPTGPMTNGEVTQQNENNPCSVSKPTMADLVSRKESLKKVDVDRIPRGPPNNPPLGQNGLHSALSEALDKKFATTRQNEEDDDQSEDDENRSFD